jgi:hypothetical protein
MAKRAESVTDILPDLLPAAAQPHVTQFFGELGRIAESPARGGARFIRRNPSGFEIVLFLLEVEMDFVLNVPVDAFVAAH